MVDIQAVEQIERILEQILQSGVHELDLLKQLYLFRTGMPFIQLSAPCTVANGTIQRLSEDSVLHYLELANAAIAQGRVTKFVPASGAATRMFKSILAVLHADKEVSLQMLQKRADKQSDYRFVLHFVQNIRSFAFFEHLTRKLQADGFDIESLIQQGNFHTILRYVIENIGLGYAQLPKGLILFHTYISPEGILQARTAIEEHLIEALNYTQDAEGTSRIHFTISPEHEEKVRLHLNSLQGLYPKNLEITLSEQKDSTNTIAVTPENEPFLTEDGLHFRPAGHGALLENLNDICADIVIIKNIDNVVPDRLKSLTYQYKRILCGVLVELQNEIFLSLKALEFENISRDKVLGIAEFATNKLFWKPIQSLESLEITEVKNLLFQYLNRPLRVCGMVKNSGEPGGGPFIVRHKDGSHSLQIVESAQINLSDVIQKEIFESSTHFNPVDVVCGLRDFKGNQFDLLEFRDDETGFISVKSSNGRELKALELPGLWNGSMAHWNTIFVEVPSETFNPVKTINDLLKPEHQN
jgi:hypothetical protein